MAAPTEPPLPPALTPNLSPSRGQAIEQAIAHLRFVEYAIACGKAGQPLPADADLHADIAYTWAILAGSL